MRLGQRLCVHRTAGPSVFLVLAATFLVTGATPAQATFAGAPGRIAFSATRDGNNEIYTEAPGGGLANRLTNNLASDSDPCWSPDGSKITFVSNRDGNNEIYSMNADGTNQTRLTNTPAFDADPCWSADGTQIAFSSDRDGNFEIYKMNANGTGQTRLTNSAGFDTFANWSPDGSKIAFQSQRDGNFEIYTMNADGTNQTRITNNAASDQSPNWSPDGGSIAFVSDRGGNNQVYVVSASGGPATAWNVETGESAGPAWSPAGTQIAYAVKYSPDPSGFGYDIATANAGQPPALDEETGDDTSPDWQPVQLGYARPKSASPLRVPFAIAYKPCTSGANTTHRGSLSSVACNPPVAQSSFITVGTPDSNGQPANSVGSLRIDAFCNGGASGEVPPCLTTAGDQLDGHVALSITDVRCKGTSGGCSSGALSDYTGDLRFTASFRITDKNNGAGTDSATLSDKTLAFNVPCATTVSTTTGSNCALNTTIDSLLGGSAIIEQKRANWELTGPVQLFDGGPDGVASTAGGNTLFAQGGLFFP
jgi:WD40-like Beta Propeller Repeat